MLVERGGSDLHLLEGQPAKIRRHGEVTAIQESPLDREMIVRLLEPICSPPAWRRFTETGDLDFADMVRGWGGGGVIRAFELGF
ncbi:MAG: hypothetical protein EB141_15860 [Verrucomicrobia bacterium]|nr:hypothetical protein [Verrucomicrobiota bacterium]